MKEFLKRSFTGALFVLVMLSAVWLSIYSLTILLLIIMIIGVYEFLKLNQFNSSGTIRSVFILLGIIIIISSSAIALNLIPVYVYLTALSIAIIFSILGDSKTSSGSGFSGSTLLIAIPYIILPLSLVPFIAYDSAGNYSPLLIISILVIIWVFDSFAYLTGIMTGKHKMFPSLSPKKSWEGFFGGIIFALLAAFGISSFYSVYSTGDWLIIAIIVAVAGTTGDFFESYLKRNAGVKDSGNFLPGHGGILDRFDSFLFAVPVVFVYIKLIL